MTRSENHMLQKPRIPVIIILTGEIGGPISWALRLRRVLMNHSKYQVLVVGRYIQEKDVKNFDFTFSDIKSINSYLKQLAPAIVIPNWLWNIYPVCSKLTQKGYPLGLIGFCRGDSEEVYYRHLRKYEPLISHFVAVSPECGSDLYAQLPERLDDITILPTAVFVPNKLNRIYSTDPVRIIYGGRIEQQQKRVLDFVPFVNHLMAANINFVFDIVGTGSCLPQLLEALQECNHKGRVRYLGKIHPDDMPNIWASYDIFIQMSDSEGTSNSMIEAMSQGTIPIVTATSSGVNGVINDSQNGFVVPIGDTIQMANIVLMLANSPTSLESVGLEAYLTSKRFSMDNYAEKFVNILDRVYFLLFDTEK